MKKMILILIPAVLLAAGCVYYPYPDTGYYNETETGYTYPYGYPYYYTYPYYYYPYSYPWWGYRYYGPRRWR